MNAPVIDGSSRALASPILSSVVPSDTEFASHATRTIGQMIHSVPPLHHPSSSPPAGQCGHQRWQSPVPSPTLFRPTSGSTSPRGAGTTREMMYECGGQVATGRTIDCHRESFSWKRTGHRYCGRFVLISWLMLIELLLARRTGS